MPFLFLIGSGTVVPNILISSAKYYYSTLDFLIFSHQTVAIVKQIIVFKRKLATPQVELERLLAKKTDGFMQSLTCGFMVVCACISFRI